MYQILFLVVFAVGSISYAIFSALNMTDTKMSDFRQAKTAITTDNKRVLQSRGVANAIENSSNLQDLNQGSLVLDQISLEQRELINKLQTAVKIAIVENNIAEPNCSDLAATGAITTGECMQVKDKQQNYISIKDGVMDIDNTKVKKIIHANLIQSQEGNNSVIPENTFLEINAQKTADNEDTAKRILEFIKTRNTKEGIASALTNIDVIAKTQPIIAKEILYTASKKLEAMPDANDTKLVIDAATQIAEEKISALKASVEDTTKSLTAAQNQIAPTTSKELWINQEITTFTK